MMSLLLALVGLLLIYLEFFLPGAILGTLGSLLVLTAVVTFFVAQEYSPAALLIGLTLAIAAVALVCKLALRNLRKAKPSSGLYSSAAQEGYVACEFDPKVIGCKGVALTVLKPSGHILVGEEHYQAMSQSGFIDQGATVEVVGGQGACLLVQCVEEKPKEGESSV